MSACDVDDNNDVDIDADVGSICVVVSVLVVEVMSVYLL